MAALSPASAAAIARLRSFTAQPTQFYSLPLARRAAVLILLFADRGGDLRVVLTIRAAKLKNYAGQAALPGGKADSLQETPFYTARREAFEEIGLPMSDDKLPPGYSVEHLTELPSNLAMTELGVRPCVAYLRASSNGDQPERPLNPARDLLPKLEPKEVAAVFTAPFNNFLRQKDEDSDTRRKVPGEWYKGSWHSWHEEAWRMHQFFVPVFRGSVFKGHTGNDSADDDNPVAASSPVLDHSKSVDLPDGNSRIPGSPSQPPASSASRSDPLAQPRYRVFGMTARILVDAARVAYGEDPEFEHNSNFGDEDMMERLLRLGRLSSIKKEGERLTRDVMIAASKI